MNIKTRYLSLLLLASFTQTLQAAELAGRIWLEKSKQPARHLNVAVQCPDGARHANATDSYGFYRVSNIPPKQKCYIFIDDGKHFADPLLFYSGQGRDTRNFSVLPSSNKLIVRQY